MIVDSHTHVATPWPFGSVADPDRFGSTDALLARMEGAGVARALVVSAIFNGSDSNALTIQAEHAHPERLIAFPQLDSMGTPTYHTPGAADRLEALHQRHGGLRGFAHYCRDYEWFATREGARLFAKAAQLKLVVSIAVFAAGLAAVSELAARVPSVTFLVHHMGRLQEKSAPAPDAAALRATLATPNVWFKLSGFHHLSPDPRGFPYPDRQPLVRLLYETVGPHRLVWGSDSPVVDMHITYPQSIDVFRAHSPYMSEADRALILGGNLARLFQWT